MDWTTGVVRVQGSGRPRRLSPYSDLMEGDLDRAAEEEVLAKLVSALRVLPVDASHRLAELLAVDGRGDEALRGLAKRFRVTRRDTVSDGAVVVRAELPLAGLLLELPDHPGPRGVRRERSVGEAPDPVLLDARGLGIVPVLRPVVRDSRARRVLAPVGLASYRTAAPDEAEQARLVRLTGVRGAIACDPVVADGDVVRLRGLAPSGRVPLVVVVDPGTLQ